MSETNVPLPKWTNSEVFRQHAIDVLLRDGHFTCMYDAIKITFNSIDALDALNKADLVRFKADVESTLDKLDVLDDKGGDLHE